MDGTALRSGRPAGRRVGTASLSRYVEQCAVPIALSIFDAGLAIARANAGMVPGCHGVGAALRSGPELAPAAMACASCPSEHRPSAGANLRRSHADAIFPAFAALAGGAAIRYAAGRASLGPHGTWPRSLAPPFFSAACAAALPTYTFERA